MHRLLGRISGSDDPHGIPGSATDHHSAPYSITEEFVARLPDAPAHPRRARAARRRPIRRRVERLPFPDGRGTAVARPGAPGRRRPTCSYSFGTSHPGAVTLHNHPRFMQRLRRSRRHGNRSRGRRHPALTGARRAALQRRSGGCCRCRRLVRSRSLRMSRRRPRRWPRCTTRRSRRTHVGRHAERRRGFGFSDTAFRIFILMASRRLKSDRFFTDGLPTRGLHARGHALDRRQ